MNHKNSHKNVKTVANERSYGATKILIEPAAHVVLKVLIEKV